MAILGYQHLNLPLGGCFSILRVYTPVVIAVHEYFLGSLVDHRLDREHHARCWTPRKNERDFTQTLPYKF